MIKTIKLFGLLLGTVVLCGCSVKSGLYTLGGTAAGAGIGYSYHHDSKGALVGGLAGGAAGALLGGIQDNSDRAKHKAGYEEGYKQAQLDVAVRNWNDNTGKNSVQEEKPKRLIEVKVPKQEQDDVVYDEHYITLEDYR
jgi:hypothetical protein